MVPVPGIICTSFEGLLVVEGEYYFGDVLALPCLIFFSSFHACHSGLAKHGFLEIAPPAR